MPTLFLICGIPGSGKTTLARQLEQERRAVRLCPDEWIAEILADHADRAELGRLRAPVESLHWELAKRVLALGTDVILEFGFWSREERKKFRQEAEALGARVELRFLDVPREELWARISRRNANLPRGTFSISQEELFGFCDNFERPSAEELAQHLPRA